MSESPAPSIAGAIGSFILRLLLGGICFVVVVALAMLSGFFSGGGSGLFVLAWVALIATPIWALLPLVRAISGRRASADDSIST